MFIVHQLNSFFIFSQVLLHLGFHFSFVSKHVVRPHVLSSASVGFPEKNKTYIFYFFSLVREYCSRARVYAYSSYLLIA